MGCDAELLILLLRLVDALLTAVIEGDLGASLCKRRRDGKADAVGGTGDEGKLPLEGEALLGVESLFHPYPPRGLISAFLLCNSDSKPVLQTCKRANGRSGEIAWKVWYLPHIMQNGCLSVSTG